MQSSKSLLTFLLIGLFMIATSTTVLAAESWVADPVTGAKIGWVSEYYTLSAANWSGSPVNGKAAGKGTLVVTLQAKDAKALQGQGEVEMTAGLLDGYASQMFSDGSAFNGYYRSGIIEGKGTYKWPDGSTYEGDWKNGKYDGKGTYKMIAGNFYEGEWKDGKFDGKGILRMADGNFYDGELKDNKFEGKGTYEWANGETYTGAFKNGQRSGYGVQKDASGKVLYEGEWKDDKQLTVAALKVDKVLGIPWGASEDEAKRIMLQRPKTSYFNSSKTPTAKWQIYVGPYNDETAKIDVGFYQEKMYQVGVHLYANEDKIMDLFNYLKSGLTERYGVPLEERGKYLDSKVFWDLGDGYQAGLVVGKNEIPQLPASWGPNQLPWRFPFEVSVYYGHPSTSEKTKKPAGKDF